MFFERPETGERALLVHLSVSTEADREDPREFEELVLLMVIVLEEDAYGVMIKKDLEERLKQSLSVGSIQSALKRMEEKGFLTSIFGEATAKRGGKRKRIYSATPYARKVLEEIADVRAGLWASIPNLSKGLKMI